MADIKKMVVAILSNPKICVNTSISNDLVREVYAQDRSDCLIPLLESQNNEILHASIWIVSELGEKCYPLLSYIVNLLKHDDAYIRYYALDCICALSSKIRFNSNSLLESIMNNVGLCLEDTNENVKEKARFTFSSLSCEYAHFIK
jgi:hypothetical protein